MSVKVTPVKKLLPMSSIKNDNKTDKRKTRVTVGSAMIINCSSLPYKYVTEYLIKQGVVSDKVEVSMSTLLPRHCSYNESKDMIQPDMSKIKTKTTFLLIDEDDTALKIKTDFYVKMYNGKISSLIISKDVPYHGGIKPLTVSATDQHASKQVLVEHKYQGADHVADTAVGGNIVYYPIKAEWAAGTAGIIAYSWLSSTNVDIMNPLETATKRWFISNWRLFKLLNDTQWAIANVDSTISKNDKEYKAGSVTYIPMKYGKVLFDTLEKRSRYLHDLQNKKHTNNINFICMIVNTIKSAFKHMWSLIMKLFMLHKYSSKPNTTKKP